MSNYTIKAGDNLTKIAKQFNTTVEELVSANKIKNANSIMVGQELKIGQTADATQGLAVERQTAQAPAHVETAKTPQTVKAAAKEKTKPQNPVASAAEFVLDHSEEIYEGGKRVLIPGYGVYKDTKPVRDAVAGFVEEHKEEIKEGAKTGAKRIFLPGYSIYKDVTSEPVKKAAGAVGGFIKDAAQAAGRVISWIYE